MGDDGSFWALLAICAFLCCTWWASKLSRLLGISSIVLEIATGVVFGPKVLGLVNAEYAECEHRRHAEWECLLPPDLRQRLEKGLSLGPYLDAAAQPDRCDAALYAARPGDSSGDGPGGEEGGGATGGNESSGNGSFVGSNKTSLPPSVTSTLHVAPLATTTTAAGATAAVTTFAPTRSTSLEATTASVTTSAPSPIETTTPTTPTTTIGSAGAVTTASASTTRVPAPGPDLGLQLIEANTSDENATEENATEVEETVAARRGQELRRTDDDSDAPEQSEAAVAAVPAVLGRPRSLAGGDEHESYEDCLRAECVAEVRRRCDGTPGVFVLIGHAGVALMIFESGMHFDFAVTKDVGASAFSAAAIGMILPLLVGAGLVAAYGRPVVPDGIAAGAAFAPTSLGIALRLLGEAGMLQQHFGQVVITAAFTDDALSLVLFSVLLRIQGEFDTVAAVVCPVLGLVFMAVAVPLATRFWPWFLGDILLPRLPLVREATAVLVPGSNARLRLTRDEFLFFFMICLLALYALITHFLGTYLWGCFLAGMSFACLQPAGYARHVWVNQTKRITAWMVRIFFACTVGFSIPAGELFSVLVLAKGCALGLLACILPKVCCAVWMESRWVVGWAMVGRAEFAYLIAQMSFSANLIDEETFATVIWALLCATCSAPFVFRCLLQRYIVRHGLEDLAAADSESEGEEGAENEEWARDEAEKRRCEEGTSRGEKGAVTEASAGADLKMRDLEGIRIEEENPQGESAELLTGSKGKALDAEAACGAPVLQDMEGAAPPSPMFKASADEKKGFGREQRRGRTRSGKQITYGARKKQNKSSMGFLCCLFFRRVLVD